MTRKLAVLCLWILLGAIATPCQVRAANVSDFIDYTLFGARGGVPVLQGRLYVPPEAAALPDSPRPIMIFLHGSGANGTNNLAQLTHVTDQMMAEAKQRGAYLYVPQATSTWSSQTITDAVM